ncbi:DUF6879 family protein [Streptomyces specialis]|uniref:DUF6879 family protein n=1 Tax=Streptomyces specialis TaxID=498367 RepID=UPI00073E5D5C|nr:DUF6879 family protein [Streptomyces specialis]
MLTLDDLGLESASGERLSLADYRADFRRREDGLSAQDSWKLERQQHFEEPGDPSWEAFARGDWSEALRLNEERRASLSEFGAMCDKRGVGLYRVRVVEKPLVPYLQWEMHTLKLRAECGEAIRVVGPEAIGALERDRPLPELINLGGDTLYEILYDDEGVIEGGVRYTDPHVVASFVELCKSVYAAGEDLLTYFQREIAHLPPPRVE